MLNEVFLFQGIICVRKYDSMLRFCSSNIFRLEWSDVDFGGDVLLEDAAVRDEQVSSSTSSCMQGASNEAAWRHCDPNLMKANFVILGIWMIVHL